MFAVEKSTYCMHAIFVILIISSYNLIIGQKTFHFSSDVLDIKVVVNPSEGFLYSEVCDC